MPYKKKYKPSGQTRRFYVAGNDAIRTAYTDVTPLQSALVEAGQLEGVTSTDEYGRKRDKVYNTPDTIERTKVKHAYVSAENTPKAVVKEVEAPSRTPMELVSPEYDALTLGRSLYTSLASPIIREAPIIEYGTYFRQGKGLIKDLKKAGVVRAGANPKTGKVENIAPYFQEGRPHWIIGDTKNYPDLLISRENSALFWQPIANNRFTTMWKSNGRVTPIYKGKMNQAPAKFFQTYTWDPVLLRYTHPQYGYPMTGLDFFSHAVKDNINE